MGAKHSSNIVDAAIKIVKTYIDKRAQISDTIRYGAKNIHIGALVNRCTFFACARAALYEEGRDICADIEQQLQMGDFPVDVIIRFCIERRGRVDFYLDISDKKVS